PGGTLPAMILRPFAAAGLTAAALLSPGLAAAELVTLTSGRTLSVRSVTVTGEQAVLQLRGGGEMTCATSLIANVAPDEVPHPSPEAAEAPVASDAAAVPPV